MPKKESGLPNSQEIAAKGPSKPAENLNDALKALMDRQLEVSRIGDRLEADNPTDEDRAKYENAQDAEEKAKEAVRDKALQEAPALLAELGSQELPTTAQRNELSTKKTALTRQMGAIDSELGSVNVGKTEDRERARRQATLYSATEKLEAMKKVLEEELRPLHDEIQKLEGNFFARMLNGSKIAELKERLSAAGKKHGINYDPVGVQELNIKHMREGVERNQKYVDDYNKNRPPIEGKVISQEEMIRLKGEQEDLALQAKQLDKQLGEMSKKMEKFADLARALDLPIKAGDYDKIKSELINFLKAK